MANNYPEHITEAYITLEELKLKLDTYQEESKDDTAEKDRHTRKLKREITKQEKELKAKIYQNTIQQLEALQLAGENENAREQRQQGAEGQLNDTRTPTENEKPGYIRLQRINASRRKELQKIHKDFDELKEQAFSKLNSDEEQEQVIVMLRTKHTIANAISKQYEKTNEDILKICNPTEYVVHEEDSKECMEIISKIYCDLQNMEEKLKQRGYLQKTSKLKGIQLEKYTRKEKGMYTKFYAFHEAFEEIVIRHPYSNAETLRLLKQYLSDEALDMIKKLYQWVSICRSMEQGVQKIWLW